MNGPGRQSVNYGDWLIPFVGFVLCTMYVSVCFWLFALFLVIVFMPFGMVMCSWASSAIPC